MTNNNSLYQGISNNSNINPLIFNKEKENQGDLPNEDIKEKIEMKEITKKLEYTNDEGEEDLLNKIKLENYSVKKINNECHSDKKSEVLSNINEKNSNNKK